VISDKSFGLSDSAWICIFPCLFDFSISSLTIIAIPPFGVVHIVYIDIVEISGSYYIVVCRIS